MLSEISGEKKNIRMRKLIDSINKESDYWKSFSINKSDIDFINNYLFESEIPRTAGELTPILFDARIQLEKQREQEKHADRGKTYLPMEEYKIGDDLVFSFLDWAEGKVISIRQGINPEIDDFSVMEVEFSGKKIRQYAFGLTEHKLNTASSNVVDDEEELKEQVFSSYGEEIKK